MRLRFLLLLLSGIILWGCQPDPAADRASPEEVLRAYQDFIDKNQFVQAELLSTPAEQKRLEEMAVMLRSMPEDSTLLETRFLNIDCRVEGDTARCRCRVEDQYERYEQQYRLVRIDGRWLVDVPEIGPGF